MCRHGSVTMDGDAADDDDNLVQVNYFYVQILKLLCDSFIELLSDKTGPNCFLWKYDPERVTNACLLA